MSVYINTHILIYIYVKKKQNLFLRNKKTDRTRANLGSLAQISKVWEKLENATARFGHPESATPIFASSCGVKCVHLLDRLHGGQGPCRDEGLPAGACHGNMGNMACPRGKNGMKTEIILEI